MVKFFPKQQVSALVSHSLLPEVPGLDVMTLVDAVTALIVQTVVSLLICAVTGGCQFWLGFWRLKACSFLPPIMLVLVDPAVFCAVEAWET